MTVPLMPFDLPLAVAIEQVRSFGATIFFIDLSELAGPTSTIGIVAIIALLFLVRRRFAAAIGVLAGVGIANLSWSLLKALIERPRPPRELAAYIEQGYSFPSGHATNAFALATFLSVLAWRHLPQGAPRIIVVSLLYILATLIAVGRVYLGVHYVSDVIAGALLGGAFGMLGAWIWVRFEKH